MLTRGVKPKGQFRSHRLIRERLRRRVDGSCDTGVSPYTGHISAKGEETYCKCRDGVRLRGDTSVVDVSDAGISEKEKDEGRRE